METNPSFQKMLAACKSDPGRVQRARGGGEILAHAAECHNYSEIKVCASATSIMINTRMLVPTQLNKSPRN